MGVLGPALRDEVCQLGVLLDLSVDERSERGTARVAGWLLHSLYDLCTGMPYTQGLQEYEGNCGLVVSLTQAYRHNYFRNIVFT